MLTLLRAVRARIHKLAFSKAETPEERNRLYFCFVFLLLGVPVMFGFSILALLEGRIVPFLLATISETSIISGWLVIYYFNKTRFVYRFNAAIYAFMLLYMFSIGGVDGSKILWGYTFPLISFFVFGKKEGAFWCLSFLCLNMGIMVFGSGVSNQAYVYGSELSIRYCVVYLIISALAYWFEYIRFSHMSELQAANCELDAEVVRRRAVEKEKDALILELQTTLEEVKTLRGMIPICSSCKKIRDDGGYWEGIEKYIEERSDVLFTHGICPDCVSELYPELAEEVLDSSHSAPTRNAVDITGQVSSTSRQGG